MASTGDIIPRILLTGCSESVCATIYSQAPRHWFLLWSTSPPTKTPVYKTIRGVQVKCGFRYSAKGWHCVEQQEPGDTLEHTFCFPNVPFGSELYYAISETCSPASGFFTSAPITYRFQECPPGYQGWKVGTFWFGNAPTVCPYQTIYFDPGGTLNNPPSVSLNAPGTAPRVLRVFFAARNQSLTTPGSARIYVSINGLEQTLGLFSLSPGELIEDTFTRELTNLGPGLNPFSVHCERLSGAFNSIQLISNNPPHFIELLPASYV